MRAVRLAAFLGLLPAVLASVDAGAQEAPKDAPVLPGGWASRAASVPVRYKIDVQLVETGVTDGVRLVGDETISWKNTSQVPVKSVYLHTYANAFRSTRSTFLAEAVKDGLEIPDDMRWGEMKLTRVSALDDELTPKWVSPDDGNPDDRTVARVELATAVEPGATLALRVRFTLDMPRAVRRMGVKNGFVMAAQWYPKLGRLVGADSSVPNVREGWYCHQYHANCEFAADFADYDVSIRTPAGYRLGATGAPQGDDVADVDTVTRRYRAESVVDFAFAADRRFEVHEFDVTPVRPDDMQDDASLEWQRRRAQRAESEADAALPPVHVVILAQPEHADQVPRLAEAARVALGFFGTWLGPYPWGRLTIVDPPWNAPVGGMEYPMLVTAGSIAGSLRESQSPEGVTIHEIGHQWLMGMLANNEAEEAWLDEGINTFLTAWAVHLGSRDPKVGFSGAAFQTTDLLGLHFPLAPLYEFPGVSAGWPAALDLPKFARPAKIDLLRLWRDLPPLSYVPVSRYARDPMLPLRRSWLRRAGLDEMVKTGWRYADRTSYAVNAYARPALFVSALRRSLVAVHGEDKGDAMFFKALREYARAYRFRHPTTADFLRVWKETVGDPSDLADAIARTTATFDYAVDGIRGGGPPKLEGFDATGTVVRGDEGGDPDKEPKSSIVRVVRRGSAAVPVDLVVTRADGSTARAVWATSDQTRDAWRDFRFDGEVVTAEIDPGRVFLTDTDLANNSRTKEPDARPAVKWSVRFLGWLENALLSYARFF